MGSGAPRCEMCAELMMLRRVFPRTWTLPEVRAYECQSCGNACSVACEPPLMQVVTTTADERRVIRH